MSVRVKICGLKRREDARTAAEAGADYLGFVFAPSPRRVDPEEVASWLPKLPRGPERVGVFVNESAPRIRAICRDAGLTMVQLHGDEPPELCRELEAPTIVVLHLAEQGDGPQRSEEQLGRLAERIESTPTELFLLEPRVPGVRGGTGRTADWALARELIARFPAKRFFLAGGLAPENVAAAVRVVGPYAVDASSGLEVAPGIKSAERIRRFVEVVRSS